MWYTLQVCEIPMETFFQHRFFDLLSVKASAAWRCSLMSVEGHQKQIIVYEAGGEVAADTFQLLLSGHFA